MQEIPTSWRQLDIEDLLKEWGARGTTVPIEQKLMQERLLKALLTVIHEQRATIKIAFRYYSLVGASTSPDEEPDSMNMTQFLVRPARTEPAIASDAARPAC
jgi:hypothetical protein